MKLAIEDISATMFSVRFLPNLRPEDNDEWTAYTSYTPAQLDFLGWRIPETDISKRIVTRAAYGADDGMPLCVWGCAPLPEDYDTGWVWLVATPQAVPRARYMHRYLQPELDYLLALFPKGLVTVSWANNEVHQVWLQWLGFEQVEKYTAGGHIWCRYKLEKK